MDMDKLWECDMDYTIIVILSTLITLHTGMNLFIKLLRTVCVSNDEHGLECKVTREGLGVVCC